MGDGDDQPAPAAAVIDRPGSTVRLVLLLAWPVLVQQLLILAVNLSDFFLAGWFPPPDRSQHVAYQAAQTTAGYLDWLITCFTVFVTVGSTALVARFVGARDRAAAVHATNQSITLAAVFGLAGTAAGLSGVEDLVRLLDLTGDAAAFAATYLRPLFALLTFSNDRAGRHRLPGRGGRHAHRPVRPRRRGAGQPAAGLGAVPRHGLPGHRPGDGDQPHAGRRRRAGRAGAGGPDCGCTCASSGRTGTCSGGCCASACRRGRTACRSPSASWCS